MKRKWILAAVTAAVLSTPVIAQMGPGMMGGYGPGPGYGMGPGMMGGYGPGGGYGMGPGMMGGYGPGGGYGMGPGMMGGYGPAGGYGMGPGMMGGYGYGGLGGLKLSDDQQKKISEIQRDVSRKQWDLMGKMHEQGFHMHQFGPGTDDKKAREAYQAMSATRQAMFELSLDARKRIEAVLTKDQLEQLRRNWRGS